MLPHLPRYKTSYETKDTHSYRCYHTYQGMKLVMRPKTHIVTDAPHTAVLLPNLSDTRPAQNEPRANPVREKKALIRFYFHEEKIIVLRSFNYAGQKFSSKFLAVQSLIRGLCIFFYIQDGKSLDISRCKSCNFILLHGFLSSIQNH